MGIDIERGIVSDCVFYDMDGVGIQFNTVSALWIVRQCSFYDVIRPVTTANVAMSVPVVSLNNVAEAAGGTEKFFDNLYSGTRKVLIFAQHNQLYNFATDYLNYAGEQGFQDLASDPLFVNKGSNDYNLQSGSPAKNSGPFLGNRGAMSDVEAGGGGLGAGTTNKSGGKQ